MAFRADEEEEALGLYAYNDKTGNWLYEESLIRRVELNENLQIHCWPNQNPQQALHKYLDVNPNDRIWSENCGCYLSLNLPELKDLKKWKYHDWLGFIRE